MKKLLIAMILCVSLNGCIWQSINGADVAKAELYCKDRMGIAELNSYFSWKLGLVCGNGEYVSIRNVIIAADGNKL